jgi:hypothetical protein
MLQTECSASCLECWPGGPFHLQPALLLRKPEKMSRHAGRHCLQHRKHGPA